MLRISPDDFANVLRRVGFAVWQLQALEQVSACYFVLVHQASITTAREEVHRMFQKSEKNTLGQLFGHIRDASSGAATFLPRFEALVQERNWLVHHSRNKNRSDMYDCAARKRLIDRIEALADEAFQLAKALQLATENHLVSQGISRQEIGRRADRIFREWTDQT